MRVNEWLYGAYTKRKTPTARPFSPNKNGNRYAVAALNERRASIDGELRECERRLPYLRETLGHLDATLAVFDPDGNPKAIKAKRPYKRVKG